MRKENGHPILFDGAMGTYYRNVAEHPLPECEMANLFDRDTIVSIHKEYISAGANAIKTNTFSANTVSLDTDFEVVCEIVKRGVALAREAANGAAEVYADIGPIPTVFADAEKEYKKLADLFLELGLRHFLFETFASPEAPLAMAEYIKSKTRDAFIITSFAVNPDGYSRSGYSGRELLDLAAASKAIDAVGYNCISGPYHLSEYIRRTGLPNAMLSIMPNAGYPTVVGNRTYYADNASYYANMTSGFLDMGFQILGGCCGTTPEHIARLAQQIENRGVSTRSITQPKKSERLHTDPVDNLFFEKLLSDRKVIAVEYDPPVSIDIRTYMENVKRLKAIGADAITIADCPVGRARFDSSLMAYKIKNEIGIDPIVHLTCRDRNLNATKALLLGLNVESILNLIIVTGDPIPSSEKSEIKAVFNFNSGLLTKYIQELNRDLFTNPMVTSMALNVNAPNFGSELKRALHKESMGASVFFTQPILSLAAVENLKLAREALSARLMGGIFPVTGYRNAVFMHEEISGIRLDPNIIEEYRGLHADAATEKAVRLSLYFMKEIEDYVDGYYLITPFNRIDLIERIVGNILS